jgi:hypothetical protein
MDRDNCTHNRTERLRIKRYSTDGCVVGYLRLDVFLATEFPKTNL